MSDLKSKKWMYLKGFFFLFGGLLASLLILIEHPTIKMAVLLIVAVWCFARAYYFAFYVIQHYIDPEYKFAGLISFLRYLLRKRKE